MLLAGWMSLKIFLFGPLTIYLTNAEEIQVGFGSLAFHFELARMRANGDSCCSKEGFRQ